MMVVVAMVLVGAAVGQKLGWLAGLAAAAAIHALAPYQYAER